ncbi:hypothetical protein [Paraflavitalea sp. CAU 1676]|uniref:hypothetical protein n=1 Tax=Paraflavitalea sp. CAU 1676 TaxID=3032598 RepID=UPI0023DC21CF|nr:hypothetical protein [Paraflavitalea sp. CAU 1676]MDF2190188.1 hypothetical protein [Paraflavitalea sp. CAU 1676]
MKSITVYIILVACISLAACNKYDSFGGEASLTGYAFLKGAESEDVKTPMADQTIYLNTGNDTSTYVIATKTDKSGYFSFNFVCEDKAYIIFTRYLKDGTEYVGAKKIEGGEFSGDKVVRTTLEVSPSYLNGMYVQFTDTLGGLLPNLPVRIYRSKVAADVDSVKYAVYDTSTKTTGIIALYNINKGKYYFVGKDSIKGKALRVFDSVEVKDNEIARKTMQLK